MNIRTIAVSAAIVGLAAAAFSVAANAISPTSAAPGEERLPEGRSGIAAEHPGDRDIEKDRRVIFVEKFDVGSITAMAKRWDTATATEIMSLSPDVPAGSGDDKSLLMSYVGGEGTGGQLYRRLLPDAKGPTNRATRNGYDRLFARFYVKFDPDCVPIHHFGTHLGGFNPATPWPQGGAGERPDGNKRFTSGVEPFGKDWEWDFYTYWQGMHVHGDGRYWGTPFLAGAAKPKVERGRWICVEMMVKVNDPPTESNGEQAFWIDGKLWRTGGQVASHFGPAFPKGRWTGGWWSPDGTTSDTFEGFRWRSTKDLAVNYVWAYLYITKSPPGHISKVWFDNIVVATEYIGPITPQR